MRDRIVATPRRPKALANAAGKLRQVKLRRSSESRLADIFTAGHRLYMTSYDWIRRACPVIAGKIEVAATFD